MFLEASEENVALAMEWVAAGFGKLYSHKAALKFAEKFEAWAFKAEAEKAGWKFAAAEPAGAAAWA